STPTRHQTLPCTTLFRSELFQALQPGSNGRASLVRRILLRIMARSHGDLALRWPGAAELSCARQHRAWIALNVEFRNGALNQLTLFLIGKCCAYHGVLCSF